MRLVCGASSRLVGARAHRICGIRSPRKVLCAQHALSDRFIAYILERNIRTEADLIDQLFNSSEKRLARTLLLLARYGKEDNPHRVVPKISQETLAEMIGTTRSRVNFFMNRFRKIGFIKYNGKLEINSALLSVVLHDYSPESAFFCRPAWSARAAPCCEVRSSDQTAASQLGWETLTCRLTQKREAAAARCGRNCLPGVCYMLKLALFGRRGP